VAIRDRAALRALTCSPSPLRPTPARTTGCRCGASRPTSSTETPAPRRARRHPAGADRRHDRRL